MDTAKVEETVKEVVEDLPTKLEQLDLLQFKVAQLDLARSQERLGRLREEFSRLQLQLPDAEKQVQIAGEAYNLFMTTTIQGKYKLGQTDSFNDKTGDITRSKTITKEEEKTPTPNGSTPQASA